MSMLLPPRIRALFVALSAFSISGCRVAVPADSKSVGSQPAASAPARPDPRMVALNTLRPAPGDYATKRIGTRDYPIPPHAKFLAGVKICLDPGHGGDAHKAGFKRGPTGVREAEMNLRLARFLRDCLTASGAEVRLTRDSDVDLDLAARAAIANEWGADLFVSLHHNAVDNEKTNYTSVWYHADVDSRPSNLDLARYLCQGLYTALALPNLTTVPLKSDQLMYKTGFGVLRAARVTACLTESSFYTDPAEEQRLRRPDYNLREAYGLYRALVDYVYAGLPRATLVSPAANSAGATVDQLVFQLDDGLRGRKSWGHDRSMILADSIVIRLEGTRLDHEFDAKTYRLVAKLPRPLNPGEHRISIQFMNMNKNSVLNPDFTIHVSASAAM